MSKPVPSSSTNGGNLHDARSISASAMWWTIPQKVLGIAACGKGCAPRPARSHPECWPWIRHRAPQHRVSSAQPSSPRGFYFRPCCSSESSERPGIKNTQLPSHRRGMRIDPGDMRATPVGRSWLVVAGFLLILSRATNELQQNAYEQLLTCTFSSLRVRQFLAAGRHHGTPPPLREVLRLEGGGENVTAGIDGAIPVETEMPQFEARFRMGEDDPAAGDPVNLMPLGEFMDAMERGIQERSKAGFGPSSVDRGSNRVKNPGVPK